jgi:hypothetical protein
MFHSENIVFTKKVQFLARNQISFRTKIIILNFIIFFTSLIQVRLVITSLVERS